MPRLNKQPLYLRHWQHPKRKLSGFDKIVLTGFSILFLAMLTDCWLRFGHNAQSRAAVVGLWLPLSSSILYLLYGVMQGIPKTAVRAPRRPTLIILTASALLLGYALT